jgi:hypothetical protein
MNKKMNIKRLAYFAAIILGLIMVIYSLSAMRRISSAKGKASSMGSALSNSSVGRFMSGKLSEEASQYDTKVLMLLIAGSILVVVGCSGTYHYRKH